MEYKQLRKNILHYLVFLQKNGFSYQTICDFINTQQSDFLLYKDFFTRFQSKAGYLRSPAKREKLSVIHDHMERFYQQNLSEDYFIDDHLEKIISMAAMARFETYLNTNRTVASASVDLAEFYLADNPAILRIEQYLKHKRQYEWELDILNYGSTFKILSVKTSNLFQKNAVVTTKEFWNLSWVDKKFRRLQFKFNFLGTHTYLLSKDRAGHWKIVENLKKNQTDKIEPEFIDHPVLSTLVSRYWEENRATANNFLAENRLLHCIAFIKTIFASGLSINHIAILERIRESCLNSYRLLNTDIISYNAFKSEINLLKKQLQLIIDGIFLSNK